MKIERIIKILESDPRLQFAPVIRLKRGSKKTPYRILISTILSLRTKDEVTHKAVSRLFGKATTPQDILKLSADEIERLIYPVGFYRKKAKIIIEVSKILIERYNGKVPMNIDEILQLPGVGRKTANIVITQAFGGYGIAVDTHVHRISNRLGLLATKRPEDTEMELYKIIPKDYWRRLNTLFVAFGQSICKPLRPECADCPIDDICPKIDVR